MKASDTFVRQLPVGAELQPAGGVHFRVWAPRRKRVEVVLLDSRGTVAEASSPAKRLQAEGDGYFSGIVPRATAGMRYLYRLDGDGSFPDPASRFQPEGPHGPSQVVDPDAFRWTDEAWPGARLEGQVMYEMHVGTFTPEGTWEAATRELPELAAAGITLVELMPVAEFPGRFGWGYDGVDLFAPTRNYGTPDDMRRFVDRAHAEGVAVILDAVYNHLGPDGAFLREFSDHYYSDRYENEWGEPINFDGEHSGPVRELFLANAGYWVREFHLDGLRLDATQQILDASPVGILEEITRRVRLCGGARATLVIAENEPQEARLVRTTAQGGPGMDAIWNDDFHHAARVAVTGRSEAYYSDYRGTPQELLSAVKRGFLFQGQRHRWHRKPRGSPTAGIAPARFVTYIENHDHVANAADGARLHQLTSPGRYRAITALLLLSPGTPLLFQGQEFAASSPFLYFADHRPELAEAVRRGRAEFIRQFPSMAAAEASGRFARPGDPDTFERCKLDLGEREEHAEAYALHRDLLRLRSKDPAFRSSTIDGAVLAEEAFVIRYFADTGADRLLVVNLGRDLQLVPAPEPLLAPVEGGRWTVLWSSEEPRYGGRGTPPLDTDEGWAIPGHAAVALAPERRA